jgi:hypothetical protein
MPSKCVDLFQKVDNSNTGITLANQPANPQGKPQYMATILPGSVMAEMLSKTDIVLSRLGHEKKKLPIQSDDFPSRSTSILDNSIPQRCW